MAETPEPSWYCLACATENVASARLCRECGRAPSVSSRQRREGVAFLLNELESLRQEGAIGEHVYLRLHQRYRDALAAGGPAEAAAAPRPAAPAVAARARPVVARREGPGWLAEQQANLLLYLGAFLIVIAVVIYVSASGRAVGGGPRMALLSAGTLLFLMTGLLCGRFPRVRQAGVVFFAVSALMMPLNFVGAYAFFFSDEGIDPTGLWLAGSLSCVLFYGAVSLLGMGRWYPVPMVVAAGSALAAVLVLADAPPEAYPGSFIALALLAAAPSTLPSGRLRDTFGQVGSWAAHAVVPLALIAALAITGNGDGEYEDGFELATRWYLPPTAAIGALFYWMQALWAQRSHSRLEPLLTIVALGVSGGAAVTLVFALDVGSEWYGPAVAIVGGLYAAGSEGFGPRWFGQRHLGWMALGAITVSWLFFEGLYADFPRHGAGVHFAAAAFYIAAARLVHVDIPVFGMSSSTDQEQGEAEVYRVPAAVGLIYAAGLTLGIGFYYLLSSLPAAETAEASDLSWAFFGLSLGIATVAATMRWWWPELRLHAYAIALGMSLFVLLASVDEEGQVALLLALYTAVALVLTLWEGEPLALALPAAYGFFALLAAWRHFEPDDAYLPLVISGVGYGLFAAHAALRRRPWPALAQLSDAWPLAAQALAFAYAVAAPVAGWVRLAVLADPDGFVGTEPFEETLLYQTAAASVLLLGLLMMAQWWLVRRVEIAVGASAVLMVALLLAIGHFRPENVQAYTAPLGAYLLAGAFLALRVERLSDEVRLFIGPLEALGAAVLMGPSFVQSFDDDAWRYGLILLGEGLGLVALALVQRRLWLLSTSVTFVVLDGVHYLFFAGGPALPNWAILAIAGTAVMAAGTAILLGRDRWTDWQRMVEAWWSRDPLPSKAK